MNLKTLNIDSNNLGIEGASNLALNKRWKNLQNINLDNNDIGAVGLKHLAGNTSWPLL